MRNRRHDGIGLFYESRGRIVSYSFDAAILRTGVCDAPLIVRVQLAEWICRAWGEE